MENINGSKDLDKRQRGITREQSAILQGVAVLFMIHHHFFNDISLYADRLLFWNADYVMRFAWFGKICVGLFAFVSGYGMCRVLEKRKGSATGFWKILGNSYRICMTQFGRLLIRYWILLVIFMSIFFLSGKKVFDIREFLENFFCLSTSYNGAFWYVEQYGVMLLLLPLIHGFFLGISRKTKKQDGGDFIGDWMKFYCSIGTIVFLLCICFLGFHKGKWILFWVKSLRPSFLLVFVVGYLMARFAWFDRVYEWLQEREKPIRMGAGCSLVIVVFLVRMTLADSPAYATLDFAFVPAFALGILLLTDIFHKLGKAFEWIGSMTVYLWLTHLFIYDLTGNVVMKIGKSHLCFWLIELILCLITAWCCKKLEKSFGNK